MDEILIGLSLSTMVFVFFLKIDVGLNHNESIEKEINKTKTFNIKCFFISKPPF